MLRKENYLYGPDDVTVPVIANFGDYLVKRLLEYGDKVAFTHGVTDSKLTFKQIAQQGMNLAVSLYHMGVRKGDTIAVCSENRYEFWGTLVGVVCVGAVLTPYNPGYAAEIFVFQTHGVTDSKLTFKQIAQQGMNLAVSLYHMGVRKGDTIAVCSENRYEFWGTLVGVVCVGAVLTPYNPGYAAAEMQHILSISKPKYIFCSPTTFDLHEKTFRSSVKNIIIFGDKKQNNTLSFNNLVTPDNGNEKAVIVNNRLTRNVGPEEFMAADVDKNDVVFMLYSSGTTGMPKGVMLTHSNIVTTCCVKAVRYGGNRVLTITPWFHAMGLNGSLAGLSSGISYIWLPKFEVDLYLKTIEKYKVDQIISVPPVLVAISKTQTSYDLSSVERITCGAAPLAMETIAAIREKFPNTSGVIQGYGCTEATIAIATDDYVNGKAVKPGSVGTVISCTTVKIVDIQTSKVLGPKQEGEICVKGPMIMKGYVGKDRREDFDEEGFFKTGDIGYHDEDGYLYIVDRLKELIKYNSYQVAPAEIEAVLLQHPAVRDVGVVGIPDRNAGEVPLAFVVTQPGKTVSQKELQDFVAGKLSNPKRIRGGVRFVPEIPKNASGKILRKVLRVMATSEKSKL